MKQRPEIKDEPQSALSRPTESVNQTHPELEIREDEVSGGADEVKKNTALVFCFDNEADQEALRDPFKKKPRLGARLPTPGSTRPKAEEPLPQTRKQLFDSEAKPQIHE